MCQSVLFVALGTLRVDLTRNSISSPRLPASRLLFQFGLPYLRACARSVELLRTFFLANSLHKIHERLQGKDRCLSSPARRCRSPFLGIVLRGFTFLPRLYTGIDGARLVTRVPHNGVTLAAMGPLRDSHTLKPYSPLIPKAE